MGEDTDGLLKLFKGSTEERDRILNEYPVGSALLLGNVENKPATRVLGLRWIDMCSRPEEFFKVLPQLDQPIFIEDLTKLYLDMAKSVDVRMETSARMLKDIDRKILALVPDWAFELYGDITYLEIEKWKQNSNLQGM